MSNPYNLPDRVSLPVFAYELLEGDEVDGERVTSVSVDGDTVTVTAGGEKRVLAREDEVLVSRSRTSLRIGGGDE